METSDTKNCYFKCSITGPLISGTRTRIISIINASKERKESPHLDLQKQLDSDANLVLYYHKQCVTLYTSKVPINRALKRSGSDQSLHVTTKKKRSTIPAFQFRNDCIICAEKCIPRDSKKPQAVGLQTS